MAWIGSYSLQQASVRYMGILYVVTHPDYKVSHNGYVNDLALVRLKKKISFSKDVAPVRLPNPTDTFSTSSSCWIIGWGDVGTDGTSSGFAGWGGWGGSGGGHADAAASSSSSSGASCLPSSAAGS